jgi:hypothetical protein
MAPRPSVKPVRGELGGGLEAKAHGLVLKLASKISFRQNNTNQNQPAQSN